MTALDAALSYASMGIFVFPCNGKQPLVQWGTESTNDPETVTQWWTIWPNAGIGVDCGRSGLVVIDLDVKNDADGPGNWERRLNGHQMPHTFNVRTPSGGWHGWYRDLAGRYRNSAGLIAPGVDVRGVGGYVVAPGSPGYRWHAEIPLSLADIPAMPDGIIPAATGGGTGHWSKLDRADLDQRDLAALEALERLQGHGAYRSGDYVAITRPGKTAGASASIGHIGPGIVRVFTPNWPGLSEGIYDTDRLTALAGGDHGATEALPDRFPSIDWHQLFKDESGNLEPDWLPGQFCERGQQIALISDGKAGKSLLIHEWCWRAVTGRSFLGDRQRAPLRVQYWDRENNRRDIYGRFLAFGATPDELDLLDYRSFPSFSSTLDMAAGALELLAMVDEGRPDVVILDTASRFISGKENDSDTWLNLYRFVHAQLKARNIAGWRLDHFGKDADRGSRGSSAKSQDVDHVWELQILGEDQLHNATNGATIVTTRLRMRRTHTRTGLGEDVFTITRRGEKHDTWLPACTHHELAAADAAADVAGDVWLVLRKLDELDVPQNWGRDRVRQKLLEARFQVGNDLLAEAISVRKTSRNPPVYLSADRFSDETLSPRSGQVIENPRSDLSRTGSGQVRTGTASNLSAPTRTRGADRLDSPAPETPCIACGKPLQAYYVKIGRDRHPRCRIAETEQEAS